MTGLGGSKPGRPIGLPKTGGRTRGTPNRSTVALRETLAAIDCDPVYELVKIARDPKTELGLKSNIYFQFMRYTHPLPKPVCDPAEEAVSDEPMSIDEILRWSRYVIERFGQNPAPPPARILAEGDQADDE